MILEAANAEHHANHDGAEHAGAAGRQMAETLGVADVHERQHSGAHDGQRLGHVDAAVDGLERVGLTSTGLDEEDADRWRR